VRELAAAGAPVREHGGRGPRPHGAREAEVCDLERAVPREQQVLGLQVAAAEGWGVTGGQGVIG